MFCQKTGVARRFLANSIFEAPVLKCGLVNFSAVCFRKSVLSGKTQLVRNSYKFGPKAGELDETRSRAVARVRRRKGFSLDSNCQILFDSCQGGGLPVVPGPIRKVFPQTPSTGERPGNFSNHRHRGKAESVSRGKTYREGCQRHSEKSRRRKTFASKQLRLVCSKAALTSVSEKSFPTKRRGMFSSFAKA